MRQMLSRFFSTVKQHVPPKKLYGIPGRYAEAVYVAASKIESLDKVESELISFGEALKKNPAFASYLQNPTISRKEKVSKISDLFDETKFTHVTRNLFLTLSANGRIGEASKVIEAYEDLMHTAKGVIKATIISSEPLKKKHLDSVKEAVMKLAGEGKTVDIAVEVNEKILGGLQIMIGDKFIDLSVSSRVDDLYRTLENTL